MGSEWKEISLSLLYDIRSGLSKPRSEFGFGYEFLTFKDVFYNIFIPENLNELVNSTEHERQNCSVTRGDVFLTRTSETMEDLGMSCVALKNYENATFNGFTKRLRTKADITIIPEYAGYYFRSPKFRQQVLSMSSLSTRASLNNEMIARLTMVLPSIEEQETIGFILKTLDDKIELNRKMNETLEGIARALFKSWFVDFDPVRAKIDGRRPVGMDEDTAELFPDELVWSEELGKEVPKGWGVGRLDDLLFLQRGFDLPKKRRISGTFPVIQASGPSGTHNEGKVKGPGVTTGRSGVLGKVYLIQEDFWPLNTTLWVKEYRKSRLIHSYFLLQRLDFDIFNAGSAVPTLNRNHVHNLPMEIPPLSIIKSFEALCRPLFQIQQANEKEMKLLSTMRDTLLPKLISGQVRIYNPEGFLQKRRYISDR